MVWWPCPFQEDLAILGIEAINAVSDVTYIYHRTNGKELI